MAAPALASSARKLKRTKRGSRNKKKNAKNIDLDDVYEHQEDVRLQERTGGIVADKPDAQLFYIETGGDGSEAAPQRPLSRKERAKAKVLFNDAALEPNPNIKPVGTKKGAGAKALYRGAVSEQAKPTEEYRPLSKRRRTGAPARPVVDDTAVLDVDGSMTVGLPTNPTGPDALWERGDPPPTALDADPWLRPLRADKEPARVPALHAKKEPTSLPAVEAPEPGTSYNPAYTAHQRLLGTALKRELTRAEAAAETERRLPAKRTPAQIGEAMMLELSGGLLPGHPELEDGAEAAAADAASDDPEVAEAAAAVAAGAVPKKVVRAEDRKTKAQRNRMEKQQQREREAKARKLQRARESNVYQLRSIKRELAAKAAEEERRQQLKEKKAADALKQPRRLGPREFRDPAPVYKLTDELTGSLRTSAPEASLVHDRFTSLQKRNEIEVRQPIKIKRRYKLKEYTKRSYKNYDLQESIKQKAKEAAAARDKAASAAGRKK